MATPSTVSSVQLQLQTVFGVRSKLDASLFFCDEQTVVYPAGNHFILANVETKSQRIFRCQELEHVDWISVHHEAALIAIVASRSSAEKQATTISFYDLHTTVGKRKRVFELRDTPMTIVSIAFSHDAKYLAVLDGGHREYTLSLWLWQKSRFIASLKLGHAESVSVLSQILFHPRDNNLVSIIGRRYCRFVRHLEGNLRIQPSSAKLDQYDFISHAWYDTNRFIAGTRNGHVCVLYNGDVQTEMDVIDGRERPATTLPRTLSTASSAQKSSARAGLHQHQQEHLDTSRPTGEEVTCISIVAKGFLCLIGGKRLCLYTKIGESWDFARSREYALPASDTSVGRPLNSQGSPRHELTEKLLKGDPGQIMWKVVVSPAEEHVLVLTNKQQIYTVSDMTKDQSADSKEPFLLELVFNSYHQAPIRGIDIAMHKPLFVSAGDDRSVRLWNYESQTIEQMKSYTEPVYSISMHPSGHQLVVAFSSKVCLTNILIDGFFTVKEYPIHAAHGVKFSHGGHLFAVLDSNIIQIISPVTLAIVHRLNHGQAVREVVWKMNDLGLYSQSSNCFVEWNLKSQSKILELKPVYRLEGGFTVDREEKFLYLASDDGYIRALQDGQVANEVKLPQEDRSSCLAMFQSNGTLLCGTHRGSIYTIRTPLSNATTVNIFHYLAHSAKITQIVVAFHEAMIISCCEDGILMLWGTQIKSSIQGEDWTPVVLHNKARFLSLSHTIQRLQVEEEEIKRQQEFHLHQMETSYLADLQRRTTMSDNERRHHENQIERQLLEKDKERRSFEGKYADLKEKFQHERQRIEDEDQARMGRELQKEEELIRLSQKMMEDNEYRLQATIEASEQEIREIAEFFTEKIRETEDELLQLRENTRQAVGINEIQKMNIDLDMDDEQLKLKLEYENEKKRLIEHNVKLQKEFKETLEQQVLTLTGKRAEQDTTAVAHQKRIQENSHRLEGMKHESASLKNEISERNQTIQEKLDRMSDLELKNQELEKFQYVLKYKIDELQRLIQPREQEIERMRNQLVEMASEREKKESELSRHRFVNVEQQRTLNAIDTQVERERRKRRECDYAVRRIKNDLLSHFSDVSDPKRVKASVAHLFEKHVQNDKVKSIYAGNELTDAISEEAIAQSRQRMFLERTTADLKSKLSSDLNVTRANRMQVMSENSLLIQELNSLREELKIVRDRIQDFEVAKRTSDQRGVLNVDSLVQILTVDTGSQSERQRDQELAKEVQSNQEKIHQLRQRLARAQVNAGGHVQLEDISILKLA